MQLLHLAPPPNCGRRDTRTANLLAALTEKRPKIKIKAAMLPQRLVYISTSGVYGDCKGALVDETRLLNPQTERALRRVDAEATGAQLGLAQRSECFDPSRARDLCR